MKSIDKMLLMERSFLLLKFQMFFTAGQKDMTKIFKKTVKQVAGLTVYFQT